MLCIDPEAYILSEHLFIMLCATCITCIFTVAVSLQVLMYVQCQVAAVDAASTLVSAAWHEIYAWQLDATPCADI